MGNINFGSNIEQENLKTHRPIIRKPVWNITLYMANVEKITHWNNALLTESHVKNATDATILLACAILNDQIW